MQHSHFITKLHRLILRQATAATRSANQGERPDYRKSSKDRNQAGSGNKLRIKVPLLDFEVECEGFAAVAGTLLLVLLIIAVCAAYVLFDSGLL